MNHHGQFENGGFHTEVVDMSTKKLIYTYTTATMPTITNKCGFEGAVVDTIVKDFTWALPDKTIKLKKGMKLKYTVYPICGKFKPLNK